jgi:hypothetical protein
LGEELLNVCVVRNELRARTKQTKSKDQGRQLSPELGNLRLFFHEKGTACGVHCHLPSVKSLKRALSLPCGVPECEGAINDAWDRGEPSREGASVDRRSVQGRGGGERNGDVIKWEAEALVRAGERGRAVKESDWRVVNM